MIYPRCSFAFRFFFIIITVLWAGCTPRTLSNTVPTQEVVLSERLKRVKLVDLQGKSVSLKKWAGRPIFLNFWATWCGPCVSEMASIEDLYRELGQDMVFLAVSNESIEKIKTFQKKHLLHFEFARLDVDYTDVFVTKLPTTLLINKQGEVVYDEEGSRVWTSRNNKDKVVSLLQ